MSVNVVRELVQVMNSMAPVELKVAAAEGLGETGDPAVIPHLVKVMNSLAPVALRAAAAKAAGRAARFSNK